DGMTRRTAAIGVAVVALSAWIIHVNAVRLLGPLKGDEATFVSMAFSLANDGDLKYRHEDYERFRKIYGSGPEGTFLKQSYDIDWRTHAGWPPVEIQKVPKSTSEQLDYGKPFAYAVATAPFAAAFGLNGLLLFNVLLLALSVWC